MNCSGCGGPLRISRSLLYHFCPDCDGEVDCSTHPAIYGVSFFAGYSWPNPR